MLIAISLESPIAFGGIRKECAEMAEFRARIATPEAKAIYRQRGAVAEFPHAWIKEKLGLRKFNVRGFVKAGIELCWACFTYNVMQWIRLCWPRCAKIEFFTAI
jgi:hypothetical protein